MKNFLSNGFLATPFFFMLSGFILSYIYWSEKGGLCLDKQKFWFLRFSRIYPVHCLTLSIIFLFFMLWLLSGTAPEFNFNHKFLSLLGTLTLVQAWVPSWQPEWNWPTWALSALVFLYLSMPWLAQKLTRFPPYKLKWMLAAMPVVSLLPIVLIPVGLIVIGGFVLDDFGLNWVLFFGSNPVFWFPHFIAGMLLSRIFGISRFNPRWRSDSPSWFAIGDLVILLVFVIAFMPEHQEPVRGLLRQGLLMPLYMIIIHDLAHGKGIFSRLLSLPGMGTLGETVFSMFIWQQIVMMCCSIAVRINQSLDPYSFAVACFSLIVVSLMSTYWLEKPIARKLRKKYESGH